MAGLLITYLMLKITFLLWLLNDSSSFSFQLNLISVSSIGEAGSHFVPIIYMQIVSIITSKHIIFQIDQITDKTDPY